MTAPTWTEQDEQEYQALAPIVACLGRFDNYVPWPEDVRRFRELQARRDAAEAQEAK